MPGNRIEYTPTPRQIAAACKRIQKTWTDDDYEKKFTGPKREQWELRTMRVKATRESIAESKL